MGPFKVFYPNYFLIYILISKTCVTCFSISQSINRCFLYIVMQITISLFVRGVRGPIIEWLSCTTQQMSCTTRCTTQRIIHWLSCTTQWTSCTTQRMSCTTQRMIRWLSCTTQQMIHWLSCIVRIVFTQDPSKIAPIKSYSYIIIIY